MSTETDVGVELDEYKWGFSKPENYVFKSRKGLSHEIVEEISVMKDEPQWMRDFRHKSLDAFLKRPMPTWGGVLADKEVWGLAYYVRSLALLRGSEKAIELKRSLHQPVVAAAAPSGAQ